MNVCTYTHCCGRIEIPPLTVIRAAGAVPAGVLFALDRQERGQGALSAAQEVSRNHGIPVTAIATLDDVLVTLRGRQDQFDRIAAIEEYRGQYGA